MKSKSEKPKRSSRIHEMKGTIIDAILEKLVQSRREKVTKNEYVKYFIIFHSFLRNTY